MFRFQLERTISIKANSIDYNLISILGGAWVWNLNLLKTSFSDLALDIKCFKCHRVVGDNGNSVPNILRSIFFKKVNTTSILSTQHRLHSKLKLFFPSRWDRQFFITLAIKDISFHSKINRFLTIWIFNYYLFLYDLFSLAFYLDMLLS